MSDNIESIKHSKDKRIHIPSKEEAGYENANQKVQTGKKILEVPKNPIIHRGQDPELFWLNKYGNDDRDDLLRIDIRSLYRHEHIAPETLIKNLYKVTETKSDQLDLYSINELFGNALEKDELEKVSEYYHHQDGWTNRLIQGDSHLVMTSLLEREGMAGQIQTIYFDPPYGIKYGRNWQIKLNNLEVSDNGDDSLSGEPEQIKAFRDTWELGIHSYLGYLRDRLLIAKELLTESGSCFLQISDENVHLVRSLMDEVFGSENFISQIFFQKTGGFSPKFLSSIGDYIIWYGKDITKTKYRSLYEMVDKPSSDDPNYIYLELKSGEFRKMTSDERNGIVNLPLGSKVFRYGPLLSDGRTNSPQEFIFKGKSYWPSKNSHWKTNIDGLQNLSKKGYILESGNGLAFKLYYNPLKEIPNVWLDTQSGGFNDPKKYVVQTTLKVIQRCLLMTTDPGDLVLDPTCGSGTTAFIAEQWGRRWITIDTSRIALNIAKQRLMTATYPYFKLYDENAADIRQGFIYKTVPHITLKNLAYDEPPSMETLYDQAEKDNKKLRVSGPFTVETLQNFDPVSPGELDNEIRVNEEEGAFAELIKQHLITAGVKNGRKDEHVIFSRIEILSHGYLHAEGFYHTAKGEAKGYFHIGPKFGTVSKKSVSEAVKECQSRGDASWLIVLGFSFESDIQGSIQTMNLGNFEVSKVRIHDDLLQEGLKKKPAKSAASFVTIGEPDVDPIYEGNKVKIEIKGLDIYDPIKDEVKPRNIHDIAYWMLDDDYDGSNFIVKQVFFCGGDKDEFNKWKKGLNDIAKLETKSKAEKTLRLEIDEEAFDRIYGHISNPIENKGQKIAVRVISQFGEESTKVITLETLH